MVIKMIKNRTRLYPIINYCPWPGVFSVLEILILLIGLLIAMFLFRLTTQLSDTSENARTFDRDSREMILSTSLSYIRLNQKLGGNTQIDLENDVNKPLREAENLCASIANTGPSGLNRLGQAELAQDGAQAGAMCPQLTSLWHLTQVRWQDYQDGIPDSLRNDYETAFTGFIESAQPFNDSAGFHLQDTENQIRRANALTSAGTGSIFLVIVLILWQNRRAQEKKMRQLGAEIEHRNRLNTALAGQQNLLSTLINNLPDPIFSKDISNNFQIANPAAAHMMGVMKPEELIGTNEADYQPPELAAQILADERVVLQSGQPLINKQENLINLNTGNAQWLLTTKAALRDHQGQITGLVGVSRDITRQKLAEDALKVANQKLTEGITELEQRTLETELLTEMIDLLQACPNIEEAFTVIADQLDKLFPSDSGMMYMINSSHNIVERVASWGIALADPQVFKPDDCWGLRRGRIHMVDLDESVNRDSEIGSALICHHIQLAAPADYVCLPLVAQGETLGLLHLRHFVTGDPADPPVRWFGPQKIQRINMIADSLSLALANLKLRSILRQQSIRDPLTGLFNRRYLEETLERELLRASRGKGTVGLIMVDIDQFKRFNDTFGHPAGDALLASLGHLFQASIRGEDIACRYGGEEFLLMLPETTLENARQRADEIRVKCGQLSIPYQGQQLPPVTLSMGIGLYPEHGETAEKLIQAVDQALYHAKKSGRDRVIEVGS
jgi:diguanylate cyclase (GGDEF)-like protein/PAS domain S-box-containing protein